MKPYYDKDGIIIYNGDCLEVMQTLEPNSFDLVLTDPPYGTTACKWDVMPNLDILWQNLKFLSKPNSGYVFSASQPFTSKLVMSNLDWFKYEWIWNKKKPGAIAFAKYQPLRYTETILYFNNKKGKYYPIMIPRDKVKKSKNYKSSDILGNSLKVMENFKIYKEKYPSNLLEFSNAKQKGKFHPTQKPVALMEYLIKTYTDQNDLIIDPFMGSGTTLVAAKKLKRRAVGIELSEQYCQIAVERLENILSQKTLF